MSLARSGEDKTVIDLISKSGPRFRHKLKIVLVLLKIKKTTLPAVLRGHKNLFFNCYLIRFARKAWTHLLFLQDRRIFITLTSIKYRLKNKPVRITFTSILSARKSYLEISLTL